MATKPEAVSSEELAMQLQRTLTSERNALQAERNALVDIYRAEDVPVVLSTKALLMKSLIDRLDSLLAALANGVFPLVYRREAEPRGRASSMDDADRGFSGTARRRLRHPGQARPLRSLHRRVLAANNRYSLPVQLETRSAFASYSSAYAKWKPSDGSAARLRVLRGRTKVSASASVRGRGRFLWSE